MSDEAIKEAWGNGVHSGLEAAIRLCEKWGNEQMAQIIREYVATNPVGRVFEQLEKAREMS